MAVERVGLSLQGMQERYSPIGEGAKGYVAPRAAFDALLRKQALLRGALWLEQVTVQEVTSSTAHALVRGTRGDQQVELRARLVIAADGSGSRLARQLRDTMTKQQQDLQVKPLTLPQDNRARFTATRGYFHGIERLSDALEFYFRGETGTTYYWIFPVGQGIANVGVIASMEQLRTGKTRLEEALTTFLHGPELAGCADHAQLQGQIGSAPIAAGLRGTALFGEHLLCVRRRRCCPGRSAFC